MSETPKFEVIDRRKMKAEEEQHSQHEGDGAPKPAAEPPSAPAEPGAGPRLVVNESRQDSGPGVVAESAAAGLEQELPPAPTVQETREQKAA